MDWLVKIFDVQRLPFKVILWIFFVSGILLFAPVGLLEKLRLTHAVAAHGLYIGLFFTAFGALAAINTAIWARPKIRRRIAHHRWKGGLEYVLNNLDHSEKAVLREFYLQAQHTIDLPMQDATVVGLQEEGIIHRVGNHGTPCLAGTLFPFRIVPEVRQKLTTSIIGLPAGTLSHEQLETLKDSRPYFAKAIEDHKKLLQF